MKVSHNWLQELASGVDLGAPETVAVRLTSLGHAVDTLSRVGDDTLYDVDFTSNRPDCLGHMGIARELVALAGSVIETPYYALSEEGQRIEAITTVTVERPDLCPRYCARVGLFVEVRESPAWLRARLEALGQRAINNVVDVTNLVLLELGHPVHAFDLDRLSGHLIHVRPALPGERLRTLDGVDRILDPEILVIADQNEAVALAGIMGGEATEVSAGTRRILVESAAFQPRVIRRASKRLGLRTEASTRFEKGCDIEAPPTAAARVATLLQELGCVLARGYIDVRSASEPRAGIELTAEQVSRLLGVPIPIEDCGKYLERLGFAVRVDAPFALRARVPSYRVDVTQTVDLVEEIARLYGYDRIPAVLPPLECEPEQLPQHLQLEESLRDRLVSMGLTEVINYSFIAPEGDPADIRPILNPISERTHLRNSLLCGMKESALHNLRNGLEDYRLFEIGHVFLPSDREREALGVLLAAGPRAERAWRQGAAPVDFYDLKGILEELFSRLSVREVKFSPTREGAPPSCVAVMATGDYEIGWCEKVSIDSKHEAYYAELTLDALLVKMEQRIVYRPIVRFPMSERDVSVLVDETVEYARLSAAIARSAGAGLTGVTLVDLYRGDPVPQGKKSLTLRLRYQSPTHTLTSAEVDSLHAASVRAIEQIGGTRR